LASAEGGNCRHSDTVKRQAQQKCYKSPAFWHIFSSGTEYHRYGPPLLDATVVENGFLVHTRTKVQTVEQQIGEILALHKGLQVVFQDPFEGLTCADALRRSACPRWRYFCTESVA
jgi:hypothetical protein